MTWSTASDYALPTSGEIRFSWIREMYDQTTGGESLSNYYRGGDIVNSSTYKTSEKNSEEVSIDISYNNTVGDIPTSGTLKLSEFRGAFKEYEEIVDKKNGLSISHSTNSGRKKIQRYILNGHVYQTNTGASAINLNSTDVNRKIIIHVRKDVKIYGGPGGGGGGGGGGTGGASGGTVGIGETRHDFYGQYLGIGTRTDATAPDDAGDGSPGVDGGTGGSCLHINQMKNDLIIYNLGSGNLKPGGGGGGGAGGGGGGGAGGNGGGGGRGGMGTTIAGNYDDLDFGYGPSYYFYAYNRGGINYIINPAMGNVYWESRETIYGTYKTSILWLGQIIYSSTDSTPPSVVQAYNEGWVRGAYVTGDGDTAWYMVNWAGTLPYPGGNGSNGTLGTTGTDGRQGSTGQLGAYYNGEAEVVAGNVELANTAVSNQGAISTGGSAPNPGERRYYAGDGGNGGRGGAGGYGGGHNLGGAAGNFGSPGVSGGAGASGGPGASGGAGASGHVATNPEYYPPSDLFTPILLEKTDGTAGSAGSAGGAGGAGGSKQTGVTATGITTLHNW